MSKKAQEEIVGFVVIVVLVAVVMVIFLGIMLSKDKDSTGKQSKEISQFLESAMKTTSECSVSYVPNYLNLNELIQECYENKDKLCLSGEEVCEALDKKIAGVLDASWKTGEDRPLKGYKLGIVYSANSSENKEVLALESGNCSSRNLKGGSFVSPSYPGSLVSSLSLCY